MKFKCYNFVYLLKNIFIFFTKKEVSHLNKQNNFLINSTKVHRFFSILRPTKKNFKCILIYLLSVFHFIYSFFKTNNRSSVTVKHKRYKNIFLVNKIIKFKYNNVYLTYMVGGWIGMNDHKKNYIPNKRSSICIYEFL